MRFINSHHRPGYLKRMSHYSATWIIFGLLVTNLNWVEAQGTKLLTKSNIDHREVKAQGLEASSWDENPETLFTLASIYCNNEEWDRLKGLTESLKSHIYLRDLSHYFIGRIALAENRIGTARREFELAIKKRPEAGNNILAHLYFYKAICLKELSQLELAKNEFNLSQEYKFVPESIKELIQLAEFYTLWNEPRYTIALINKYPDALLDNHFELSAILGRAYLKINLPESAINSFSKSLAKNPQQENILNLRANTYRQLGNYDAAFKDIEEAIVLNPNQPTQNYILGLIHFELGNLECAFMEFSKLESLYSENVSFLLLYASLAQTLGETSTARSALSQYLSLELQNPNENALYLNLLLNNLLGADPKYWDIYPSLKVFKDFIDQATTKDELLPNIYKANLSYYLAQVEQQKGSSDNYKIFLKKTIELSNENTPECLLAQWQLKENKD